MASVNLRQARDIVGKVRQGNTRLRPDYSRSSENESAHRPLDEAVGGSDIASVKIYLVALPCRWSQ